MTRSLAFWIAHLNVLAMSGVLLGGFGIQFVQGELPCPLCLLQRMAMMLCALGPAYIIMKSWQGPIQPADFTTGYGMSILAAVGGGIMSSRHVLLHILPSDPGYGDPVMGLHLYTWALIVFVSVIVVSGLNLLFAADFQPVDIKPGWFSKGVIGLLAFVILANVIACFFEEGLHWILPDNPERYRLLRDLGMAGG